jgi:hypothetical protein
MLIGIRRKTSIYRVNAAGGLSNRRGFIRLGQCPGRASTVLRTHVTSSPQQPRSACHARYESRNRHGPMPGRMNLWHLRVHFSPALHRQLSRPLGFHLSQSLLERLRTGLASFPFELRNIPEARRLLVLHRHKRREWPWTYAHAMRM